MTGGNPPLIPAFLIPVTGFPRSIHQKFTILRLAIKIKLPVRW
jgi:hypothetical protein